MRVESREYKLLVQHEPFVDANAAAKAIWDEIEEAAKTVRAVRSKGRLDEKESRRVVFLDTPDQTLRRHGLILRQRHDNEDVEYTLKCRSEDRYVVAGTDVTAVGGFQAETKLEEDIAPPFRCRFSLSTTVDMGQDLATALKETPHTLGAATALFPVLGSLRVNGRRSSPETPLRPVNNLAIDEWIWKGGKFVFEHDPDREPEKATVALILWTRGKDNRPAIAELSFRIKNGNERFNRPLAESAQQVYRLLQRLDCARTQGLTKTEYIYRDGSLE